MYPGQETREALASSPLSAVWTVASPGFRQDMEPIAANHAECVHGCVTYVGIHAYTSRPFSNYSCQVGLAKLCTAQEHSDKESGGLKSSSLSTELFGHLFRIYINVLCMLAVMVGHIPELPLVGKNGVERIKEGIVSWDAVAAAPS